MASLNFDIASHEAVSSAIPAGEYVVEAVSSEQKQTNAGTGSYISMQFKVLQGNNAGRTFFQLFNIHNPNEIAQQIGRDQLKNLCLATGKNAVNDTNELHGIPFLATLKVVDGGEYPDKNEIKKFQKIAGQGMGNVQQGQSPSATAADYQNQTASPSNAPAWKRPA